LQSKASAKDWLGITTAGGFPEFDKYRKEITLFTAHCAIYVAEIAIRTYLSSLARYYFSIPRYV